MLRNFEVTQGLRTTRRLLLGGLLAVAATLALPSLASAAVYCVHGPCVGVPKASVQAAIDAANLTPERDRVNVGAGLHEEPQFYANTPVDIVGAGNSPGGTVLLGTESLGPAAPYQVQDSSATISDLAVSRPGFASVQGLLLAGAAENVGVIIDAGATNASAVLMEGAAAFRSGIVVLGDPVATATGIKNNGGSSLKVEDSRISAGRGIQTTAPMSVRRSRVTATVTGIDANSTGIVVDSTLIRLTGKAGVSPGFGLSVFGQSANAEGTVRNVTIVGDGTPNQRGLHAGSTAAAASTVDARGLVIRDVEGPHLFRAASGSGPASLAVAYSDYDFSKTSSFNDGILSLGEGRVDNVDPLFVNAGAGDFRLSAASPLIDMGDPAALEAFEFPADADGQPRVVNGDADCAPRRDMGAFEFQPPQRAPNAAATASALSAPTAASVTFDASGSCDPDGTPVTTYSWRFSDGGTASGPTVQHAFAWIGQHSATVTVSDGSGATAEAIVRVVVTARPGRCVNVFTGLSSADNERGSPSGDLMRGFAGNDKLFGEGGDDCLFGGTGNDGLNGGAGKDSLKGESGKDKLSGVSGNDRLDGGRSHDSLSGGAGNDRLTGGTGNDKLSGGTGRNVYSGGSGNDTITSFNKKIERVNCGSGRRDKVRADARDKLRGCERVTRVRLIRR